MKRVILCLLALLLVLTGCNNTSAPAPSASSVAPTPTNTSSPSAPLVDERELTLSGEEQWTWNELYDYLENPRQSGDFSFSEDNGETVTLLDTDGKTSLSNQWNQIIVTDMLVLKYNEAGDIIGKYRIVAPEIHSAVSHQSEPASHSASSAPVGSAVTPQPQTEKQLLTLYLSGENDTLKKAVADFNKQSKTAEIVIVNGAASLTAEHLKTLANQNNCPDLVILNHRELQLAQKSKQLINLSKINVPSLNGAFLKQVTVNKGVYGLPVGGTVTALACNDELLFRAGAKVPATYEQLIENAKLLRDTLNGVIPIGLTTDIADTSSMAREFSMFLAAQGGTLFTPDGKSSAFYSQAGSEALSVYETLQSENLIADYVVRKDIYNEKIGYGIVSSADYERTFGKKAKSNFTAAPLVAPGEKTAVSSLDLYSFCVPAATTKEARKEAYAFLQFFYENTEYSVSLCKEKGLVPALPAARENEYFQSDAWQVFIAAANTALPDPVIGCYPTLETYLAECVSSVLAGTDKETALEKAFNKTENRLARE